MTYVTAQQTKNPMAYAGFILGIVAASLAVITNLISQPGLATIFGGFAIAALPALLAVIFGFIGIGAANKMGGARRTQAIWAVILGFTPLLWSILGWFVKVALVG